VELKKSRQVVSEVKDSVDQLHKRHDDRERRVEHQAILDWLTPIDYASQQTDLISRRQEGTGQWLLESNEFQQWLGKSKQTLFCPGMPGAGKTMIASIAVDLLCTRLLNDDSVGVAYLYCNFNRREEQKPTDLLLSLLKQLLQERTSAPEGAKSLYERHERKRTRPSFDEISKVLHSIITEYSRVFIIIDALDEYQVSDGGRNRLLAEVFSLQAKTGLSLFATSRFIPEITKAFEGSIKLEVRASDEDVQRYLDGHMSELPLCVSRSPSLQEQIKTGIIKTVDGMYVPSNVPRVDKSR
jgi:predicted ATPase